MGVHKCVKEDVLALLSHGKKWMGEEYPTLKDSKYNEVKKGKDERRRLRGR